MYSFMKAFEIAIKSVPESIIQMGGLLKQNVALGEVANKDHYLSLELGMKGYSIGLGLAMFGLALFLMKCDMSFARSLSWRPKSGNQRTTGCWLDSRIWSKGFATKDDEKWDWLEFIHPIYLPFDLVTPWLCTELVDKYVDKNIERPQKEEAFVMRVVELYKWWGKDGDEVNKAITKLCGKWRENLEKGVDGQFTFIKRKSSSLGGEKVKPEET